MWCQRKIEGASEGGNTVINNQSKPQNCNCWYEEAPECSDQLISSKAAASQAVGLYKSDALVSYFPLCWHPTSDVVVRSRSCWQSGSSLHVTSAAPCLIPAWCTMITEFPGATWLYFVFSQNRSKVFPSISLTEISFVIFSKRMLCSVNRGAMIHALMCPWFNTGKIKLIKNIYKKFL